MMIDKNEEGLMALFLYAIAATGQNHSLLLYHKFVRKSNFGGTLYVDGGKG